MRKSRVAILPLALLIAAGAVAADQAWGLDTQAKARLTARQQRWAQLTQTLRGEIQRFDGASAVVIEDLKRGWRFEHRAEAVIASASLAKIPIMMAAFQAAVDGKVRLADTVQLRAADQVSGSGVLKTSKPGSVYTMEKLIELMITKSDNTATNLLIKRLGYKRINQDSAAAGLRRTTLVRKMMDFSRRDEGVENFTSAEDVAKMLLRLYQREYVDRASSERAISLLKRQKYNDRIPAKLPPGTVVAHKTGLERHLCHDAGIVFTKQGDFLIVVLTKSQRPSQDAKAFIAALALQAYQYMALENQ